MDNLIEFDCSFEDLNVNLDDVSKILPVWKTKVLELSSVNSILRLKFLLAANTVEEIKEWQKAYEELNFCSYSVKSTEKCSGRYLLFKQRLYCQRNTHCSRTWKPEKQNRTRNTNCPSSIQFTLRAVKSVYRGKNKNLAPVRSMPCVVRLVATHNHTTNSPDALRYRQVSDAVKEKLIKLYESGHTAGSALEALKDEIRRNFEDYETKLTDRKYCPDYSYCYHLYTSEFKKRYTPTNLNKDSKDFLLQHFNQYNQERKEVSIRVAFPEDSSYVICICPPLFRRIHEMMKSMPEMVIMDSSGTLDRDVGRIFILFANSECGGLPLGVIIISSRKASLLSLGFDLLKEMLGEVLFGGNVNGPKIFLINDSSIEQAAVKSFWTNSHCLLHIFHVLRSIWKWLLTATNEIEQEDRYKMFHDFKNILYADTLKACHANYEKAVLNGKKYTNYLEYLEQYWSRKELWTISYRRNLLTKKYKTDNCSEAVMWLLKEKIFDRTKSHSLIQVIDFVLTKFVQHYEKRTLDAAYNKLKSNFYTSLFKTPPKKLVDRIHTVSENIYLVPSENEDNLFYIVNTEVLICTCSRGNTQICKHINWMCFIGDPPNYLKKMDNLNVRQQFYKIATGKEPSLEWLTVPQPARTNKLKNSPCKPNNISVEEVADNSIEVAPEPDLDVEELLREGREVVEGIFSQFKQMFEQDPLAMISSLKIMEENAAKIDTVAAFASACENFGSECHPDNDPKVPAPAHQLLLVNNNLVLGKVLEVGNQSTKYLINYNTHGT